MRSICIFACVLAGLTNAGLFADGNRPNACLAAEQPAETEAARQAPARAAQLATVEVDAAGRRVPWTTSRVIGSPDPPAPFRVEVAFKNIRFSEPLVLDAVPGQDAWLIAERYGKLFAFENRPDATPTLVLDVGRTVYGATLHPRFAEHRFLYVTSVLDPRIEQPRGSRLSRFTLTSLSPLRADRDSEEVLLEWPSGGHNGGGLRFGPDGMLYLATGDGSGIADGLQTGQDLGDLLGAMLRIDVDRRDAGLNYAIPPDNPFVDRAGARGEIWAYGLRQPWRFSFDRDSGRLWAGEVGQDLWEEILLIEKGGNYGWSIEEGNHPFRPERRRGPTPLLKPVAEHHHVDFRSITGGWVYHGSRLPELRGAYIYGDYDTGKIWELRYADGKVVAQRELADTQLRIIDFGQDAAGEVLMLDFMGRIYRLSPSAPAKTVAAPFPQKLSETGLFSSTSQQTPAPGVIPYSVNAPLWSDGAHKERWLGLPGNSQIEFETVVYPQPAPGARPGWRFPDGTVLVKTFSLEMEAGNPASRRKLETRLLHHEATPGNEEVGTQVWRGYTYVWNDEQTDAKLLPAAGLDRTLSIKDSAAPGGRREQIWHFPSRAECALCHNMAAKYALGVNTEQMNCQVELSGGERTNQLVWLEQLGVFTKPLPKKPEQMPRLVDYTQGSGTLNTRARAYLHANCSHCHRKWGGGNAEFQLLASLPLAETGIIAGRLGHGALQLKDPRLVVPGEPNRSMILHRMQKLGLGRMPHIASNVVDAEAVQLLREWISELPQGE